MKILRKINAIPRLMQFLSVADEELVTPITGAICHISRDIEASKIIREYDGVLLLLHILLGCSEIQGKVKELDLSGY